MKLGLETSRRVVGVCFLSMSLFGCEDANQRASEKNAISFLGQFTVDNEVVPTKSMGLVTFSKSSYGILIDAYFRALPLVGPVALIFDQGVYCDNLRRDPIVSGQDSEVYVWEVDRDPFDHGFGELHTLIPTRGSLNAGPVEKIHNSKYMALVSQAFRPQVIACLRNSIEIRPLAMR